MFEADDPFQEVHRNGTRLHGPGVADCKGGLVLAVEVLRYLERVEWSTEIGWEFWSCPMRRSVPSAPSAASRGGSP